MNTPDRQYIDLLKDVYENGYEKNTRSGKTRSLFGKTMRFDLQKGFPLLTTKKMFFRGIAEELLWFLRGETNIKSLIEKNVHIWDDDAYRFYKECVTEHNKAAETYKGIVPFESIVTKEEFLEDVKSERFENMVRFNSRGNAERRYYYFGDLGPIYGRQWRAFGYNRIDQITSIIETLKINPDDRRMLCIAFNPDMLEEMALPPCHIMSQFYTRELSVAERWELYAKKHASDEELMKPYRKARLNDMKDDEDVLGKDSIPERSLSCYFYCRSQDLPLGTPFNIASYALLTHIIAHQTGMAVGELVYGGGDCHIYENQMEGVKEQIQRNPYKYRSPKLHIKCGVKSIEEYTIDDFEVEGYESYDAIRFPLSVG